VGCLISLLILSKGRRRWWAIGALVLLLAASTVWIEHSRGIHWFDRSDVGTQFRVLMWEDGARLIRQHPWFGVGMETVRWHYREWNIRGFIQYNVVSHFHSTIIQIAVERGIPALLAWLWFTVAYIAFLARLAAKVRERNRVASGIVAGLLAAFSAFTLTSFVHYNLGEEPIAMLLFFYYGLAVAIDQMASSNNGDALTT
jgi:O-antigen ligase